MPTITQMKNGIKIVTEPLGDFKSCAVAIWIKSGTIYEKENEQGMSHFIEHMLFKGTISLAESDISDIADSLGGGLNAYTTKEYTCVVIRTLGKYIGDAFELISDMVLNSVFDKNDMESEKGVVLSEIASSRDSPENTVHELIHNTVFEASPVGRPILGTQESVSGFKSVDILNYYNRRYTADNIVISAAGNFDEKSFITSAKNKFGGLKACREKEIINPDIYIPGKKVLDNRNIRQTHICLALPGISRDSELKYPYMVFNAIFGEGINSVLFKTLRREGLVYTVYSYMTAYNNTGAFTVYFAAEGDKALKAYNRVLEETNLFTESIDRPYIEKTKKRLVNSYIMGRESVISAVNSIGGSTILRGRVITDEEVISGIHNVTAEDIIKTAETVLKTDMLSLAAVGDVSGIKSV